MGPITLFDKSFIQSLSVDESVWFDHFFISNICPLFYVETLADLEKSTRAGRTPEQEVGLIADKFPDLGGNPSAHHAELCLNDLLGDHVPLTGQIPLAGGRLVKIDGKGAAVFERTPEADAFSRWQRRDFLGIERQYAREWRATLAGIDLNAIADSIRAIGVDGSRCKTMEEAQALAEQLVSNSDRYGIEMALHFLKVPLRYHSQVRTAWSEANFPTLAEYAPYATHVLTVQIFFQIALAASLISPDRASNQVDIGYLFYLPFCMLFVSTDRLHRRAVPAFLQEHQEFVWGADLKAGLRELNEHFLERIDEVNHAGVVTLPSEPPIVGTGMVAELWNRIFSKWSKPEPTRSSSGNTPPISADQISQMAAAPAATGDEIDFDPREPGRIVIKRQVRRKKGSWFQIAQSVGADKD